MKSQVIIYKDSKILPDRMFKVDDIAGYLDNLSSSLKISISNFQYIKHSLQLSIKIDRTQLGLEYKDNSNYNYCSIKNYDSNNVGRIVYYFIVDKKWLSPDTIQLFLNMDTINTFDIYGYLSDKTKILRQHKDRYQVYNIYGSCSELDNFYNVQQKLDQDENIIGATTNEYNLTNGLIAVFDPYPTNWQTLWTNLESLGVKRIYIQAILDNSADRFDGRCVALSDDFEYKASFSKIKNTRSVGIYMSLNADDEVMLESDYDEYRIRIEQGDFFGITFYNNTGLGNGQLLIQCLDDDDAVVEITTAEYNIIKNMFYRFGEYNVDNVELQPIIDLYNEGFNPVLFGKEKMTLKESLDATYYLLYQNQNNPSESLENPVDCILCADRDIIICNATSKMSGTWTFNEIKTFCTQDTGGNGNMIGYISGILQPDFSCYYEDGGGVQHQFDLNKNRYLMITFDNVNQLVKIYLMGVNPDGTPNYIASGSFNSSSDLVYTNFLSMTQSWSANNPYPESTLRDIFCLPIVSSSYFDRYDFSLIPNIEYIDRTSARMIKIIECPYCPITLSLGVNNCYRITPVGSWETFDDRPDDNYVGKAIKLANYNYRFVRTIDFVVASNLPYYPLKTILMNPFNKFRIHLDRDVQYETKLYHSDFYQPKFIYDSFSFRFDLERISNKSFSNTFKVKYNQTNTINSRMMFTFSEYVCSGLELQDYNNILCVSRNNELPLFNQQYINYIRAGYNYDVKNKTRQEVVAFTGATLSLIAGIASLAGSASTGGATVAMGVGFLTSSVGQYMNAVSTTIQAEQNFQMKQDQLKQQSTAVYGSDDVDLLNEYTGGRAKLKLYEVSDRMKSVLFNLFYYTGYIGNFVGLPDMTSRSLFNFVQMEAVFKQTPNLPKEILDDIVLKYKLGITILHKHNGVYDFEQHWENWENSILESY